MAITLNGTTGITTPAIDNQGNLTVDGGTIKLDGNYPVGTGNVALGDNVFGFGNLSGSNNTAMGQAAMYDNSTGAWNLAAGYLALENNTTGSYNVALGASALAFNTTASDNTAVGYQAGYNNTGASNLFTGAYAGYHTTTGTNNTYLGMSAGPNVSASTGSYNTAVGNGSLLSNTTADNNTAVGYQAGYSNTTGTNNVALGKDTLRNVNTTSNNTAVGNGAGYTTTGEYNTFLGRSSGGNITTGSKNTIIGSYNGNTGGLDIRTLSNNIVLSDGDGNPRLRIDSSGNLVVPQVYNTTTGGAANVYVSASGTFYRSTSSLRYKNTVNDATHGLTELLALRPVTYKGNNDGDTIFGGLIAEEVHDAGLTEFVQYNDDGEPDALAYSNMVSLCIKAIQEQQATITALTARITALEGN